MAEGESYSDTATRLVHVGALLTRTQTRPAYIGTFDGPPDLGENAEQYLADLAD